MTSLQQPEKTKMTRVSWRAQKVLREITEWHTWTGKSLDNFLVEVKALTKTTGMPAEDLTNLGVVLEQLTEYRKNLKPVDRCLAKATGQRIHRSRAVK